MIPQSTIDEIISKTNLQSFINEFIPLKKNGVNYTACCPFHKEKSPSFTVSNEKGIYKCFGCGKSGNAITFLIEYKQMSFYDSVKLLADKYGIYFNEEKKEYKKPTWKNNTNLSNNVVKWFEGRSITQETLTYFKIGEGIEGMPSKEGGYKDINTIQFPYFRNDDLVNIKYRGGLKEFKSYSGAELILFNLNSIKNSKKVICTEGEIDTMSFHQAGFPYVVSVPNGASVKGEVNLDYLNNCIEWFLDKEEIIIATDDDIVGRKLREAIANRLGKERCYFVTFKGKKDANECLQTFGIQGLIECVADKKEFPLEGVFTVKDYSDEIDDMYNNGLPKGSKTMMSNLNKLITFHKGYIYTFTGKPGDGKSDLVDQITLQLAVTSDWKGGFYSPENKPTSLHVSKLARKLTGKSWWGENRITKKELEQVKDFLNDKFFFIKPEADFTLDSILKEVKGLVLRKGIDFFVIDAWNKLEHKYNNNESKYIGESLDKLAVFCETNNVLCFLVAHPTKMQKDKFGNFEVPNLYSISGSSNFFNKTDGGISVYRDFDAEKTIVYVQKVKFSHWGGTGSCEFKYDLESGRFNELDKELFTLDRTPWIRGVEMKEDIVGTDDFPF